MTEGMDPVSPVTMNDHIDPVMARSPEITGQEEVHDTNGDATKAENSVYDTSRPQHSNNTPSWRSRFIGRAITVDVDELETGTTPPIYEPIEDRETHFPPLSETQMRGLRLNFNPSSQIRKLLFTGFIKWFITVAFIGVICAIMYYYSTHVRPMTDKDKQTYNFLIVGLSLALGMNLASSLKQMAVDMRWLILSLKRRNLREVDLILHLDGLTEVTKLAFVAPRLAPACFAWLFLNIAAQVGIALIGLCYSPDSVTDTALISNGTVLVPDMSQVFTEAHSYNAKSETISDQQYTANNFGQISLNDYTAIAPDDVPDAGTLWSANSPIIFQGFDANSYNTYWEYVFQDVNADAANDTTSTVAPPIIFTNRTVNATWSCDSWLVTEGGNGTTTNLTIILDSNNDYQYISIPYAGGSNQSTFITNPGTYDCGPGCSVVHVFEASDTKPWWYECNITVSEVHNATLPQHQIGQQLAHMAAAGIALQGHIVEPSQQKTGDQYQWYPATSFFGFPNGGDTSLAGSNIAQFAIGVIATAADWNPQLTVVGDQPDTGSQLSVTWDKIEIIFGLTAGLQFVLFVIASMIANLVIVKDDSHIATARLLRPIVDRLGPVGTAADGDKICKLLDNHGHEKVIYSVKHPQKGILHHLDLGHQKRLRAFPRGDYD